MGFFANMRESRVRRLAERNPIADELWDWAMAEHRIFRGMPEPDRIRLRDLATRFLAVKRFEPVGGVILDGETRVSVAAQACLPLLGLDLDWYREFTTIFITPEAYRVTQRVEEAGGVVREYEDEFAGEAFDLGPVALSLPDIEASGWGDGYNTVIHEMAHKLDSLDGIHDGRPPLHPGMDPKRWSAVFAKALQDLRASLEKPNRGGARGGTRGKARRGTVMDPYAAESIDEFFAVACEYFWEKPSILVREFPEVSGLLAEFFRREPFNT